MERNRALNADGSERSRNLADGLHAVPRGSVVS